MILTMGDSPFCSHRGSLALSYLPWPPTHLTLLCQWTHLQQISTQALAKNHCPPSTVRQYTPTTPFPHPQFPSFCKRQLTLPTHIILWSPSPIVSTYHSRGNKWELIRLLRGIDPEHLRREFDVITTMPPITADFQISQFFYSHYQVQYCNHIHPLGGDRADTFDK